MDIDTFIKENRLGMSVTRVPENPNMAGDPKWARAASHWYCVISKGGVELGRRHNAPLNEGQFTTYFSQGSAHKKPPQLRDVLDSLASDAQSVEGQDFESWATDLGFDPDSRSAERTFQLIRKQSAQLKALLGRANFDILTGPDMERL